MKKLCPDCKSPMRKSREVVNIATDSGDMVAMLLVFQCEDCGEETFPPASLRQIDRIRQTMKPGNPALTA